MMYFHGQLMAQTYQRDNTPSPLDDSQDPNMYVQSDGSGDNNDDQLIIDPIHAKKRAIDDLECIMSSSSSSNFIVSTAPLDSTFELPKQAYGDAKVLRSIQWDLAEDTSYESKTHTELIAELQETHSEF